MVRKPDGRQSRRGPGDTVKYTAKQTNTGAVAIQDGAQTSIDLGGTLDDAHYNGDAPAAVGYSTPG